MHITQLPHFTKRAFAPLGLRAQVAEALPQTLVEKWHSLSGGLTNRLWRVGDLVVKQFNVQAQSLLFPNDPLAERSALEYLSPHGIAPEFCAAGADWLAYQFVKGETWAQEGAPVARHLGQLHNTLVPKGLFRDAPSGSAALFKTAEQLFVLCKGPTPPAPLVKTLGPVKKPCLIHADMVAGNIIVGPEGLRFIDWQCPAVGDPAEDLAMFLSPAMQALYRGKPLQAAEAADFLNAYPDQEVVKRLHELLPLFHYRMAAYCLWRAQNGFPAYKVGHDFEMAILARLSD